MRAVLMRDGELAVEDVPEPEPQDGEVVVDVLACGICGSDLHCARHGEEFNAATRSALGVELMDLARPVVFGHEYVGTIAAHGPGTSRALPEGTRVLSLAALPRDPTRFIGFCGPEVPGGYAERMLLSEPLLLEVPDHLETAHAAMTEPLAVAYRTVEKARLGPDDVALVVGCGPIGLAVVAVLRMRGVSPIIAADFSPNRRRLAGEMGADIVVDPAESSPYTAWSDAAHTDDPERMAEPTAVLGQLPLRPTVAFECVGVPGMIQQIVEGAPATSRIVVAGLCMAADRFQPTEAVLKEVEVRFSLMYSPQEFEATFRHLCAGELDVAPLISATVGLEEVPDAFARLGNDPVDAKILLDPTIRATHEVV